MPKPSGSSLGLGSSSASDATLLASSFVSSSVNIKIFLFNLRNTVQVPKANLKVFNSSPPVPTSSFQSSTLVSLPTSSTLELKGKTPGF